MSFEHIAVPRSREEEVRPVFLDGVEMRVGPGEDRVVLGREGGREGGRVNTSKKRLLDRKLIR